MPSTKPDQKSNEKQPSNRIDVFSHFSIGFSLFAGVGVVARIIMHILKYSSTNKHIVAIYKMTFNVRLLLVLMLIWAKGTKKPAKRKQRIYYISYHWSAS